MQVHTRKYFCENNVVIGLAIGDGVKTMFDFSVYYKAVFMSVCKQHWRLNYATDFNQIWNVHFN